MDKEVLDLPRAELQFCAECPTCHETFKLKLRLQAPFIANCTYCRHPFLVVAPPPQTVAENNEPFALAE
jgi:hypothetical protein